MHIIELYPVNTSIVFFSLASIGAIFLWKSAVYRTLAFFFLYQSVLMLLNFTEKLGSLLLLFDYTGFDPASRTITVFLCSFIGARVELTARQKWIHLIPMLAVVPSQYTAIGLAWVLLVN